MSRAAALAAILLGIAFPTVVQAQAARTMGSASIEEPAGAKVVVDLVTQTALVLSIQTPSGDISSISVPGAVAAVGAGGDTGVALQANAALLDASDGIAPAGLSVNIGGAAGANGPGSGPMLILVQYN
ncbi:MAG: hypothetical protein EOP61_26490 [Sphingomonadales bacterium]|nr:MAG: hypothetical protein EOP61_26490 [Sphingomonadales bacterium]